MSLRTTGRILSVSRPSQLYGPTSIFRENAATLEVHSSQVYKEKLANQLYYGNVKQGEENKFYGYSGMGFGGSPEGFYTSISFKEFSNPIYLVTANTPRVKVWLVKPEGTEEEIQEEGYATNLQSKFNSVPMPNPELTVKKALEPAGTDKAVVVWNTASDEMWEFERLGKFAGGPHAGEWKFNFGGYISPVSKSNGIPPNGWGASASGLGLVGGNISTLDMVNVLRGKPIGHAIGIALQVLTSPSFVAPATRADSKEKGNIHEFLEDGITPNPAFGMVDAVPEGLWCRFPPTSKASEYGISTPLAKAIYEAIREHGLFVRDRSGNSQFFMNDPRSLFSIYSDTTSVDPFSETTNSGIFKYIEEPVPESERLKWKDPTLEIFTEATFGTKSVLSKMPWRTLEELAPRSS